jgi:hypothetical protein
LLSVFFWPAKNFSHKIGDVTGMVSRHLPKEGTDKVIFQDLVVKDPEEGLQSLFASGPLVQSGYRWFHSSKLRISHILILFMPTPDTHTGHPRRTSKPDIQAGQKIGAGKDFLLSLQRNAKDVCYYIIDSGYGLICRGRDSSILVRKSFGLRCNG